MKKLTTTLLATLLMAAVAPVYAEDATATLRVDRGTVMVSVDGGDFVSANSGRIVATGQRLMVAENSAATVIYEDDCDPEYTDPGVYVIQPDCKAAVVWGTDWRAVGIIAGTGVIGAILLAADGDGAPPRPPSAPISR